jgi:UDP-glucose 4-epimerase
VAARVPRSGEPFPGGAHAAGGDRLLTDGGRGAGGVGPALEGRTALVVGGAGFVGSNLCLRLLKEGAATLTVVDNLLSAEEWNVPPDPRVDFRRGSIADDAVVAGLADEFDYVFHLATFHGNQNSIAEPLLDHDNNSLTTLKLLERIKGFRRVQKVVYSSAGCSLGEKTPGGPTVSKEETPITLFFDSPYQISKIVGELYGNYYFTRRGVPFVKARFQNVYGPREVLGAGPWRGTYATVWRNVVPTFVYRALKGLPLTIEGEGASRDFIFVDDIVEGLVRCAAFGEPGEVYNLGTGEETSIGDLARLVVREVGSGSEIVSAGRRVWDSSVRRYASTVKAQQRLGFQARVPVGQGIPRTISWTRDNLSRIDAAIEKHGTQMAARPSG